jgi:two-component system sensor histidine kinase DegS
LRNRRDELEIRLRRLEETVNKADNLMSQIGVIIGYLRGDLARFNEALEKAQHHQLLRLQIIQAQEEERKRVARDIHDGPAQLLANVMIRSEIVERMLKSERYEEARKELATMKDMVRNSLSDVRKIIFDLRPMALDDLGLVPTLRKYMKDIEERTTLTVELKTYGEVVRLPSTLEVAVFRLVQECLSNAIKHAKARTVKVSLEFARNVLLVVVKDDGIGFIPEQTQKGAHYGILGMKERITLLSGTMQIHSAPGNGTTVYFRIPLKDEWVKKGDRATV